MPAGDFKDLYTQAINASQRDPGSDYDVDRAKEAVNNAWLHLAQVGVQWQWLTIQGELEVKEGKDTYSFTDIALACGVPYVTEVLQFSFNGPKGTPFGHYASWEDFWAIKSLNPVLPPETPHIWTVVGGDSVQIFPVPDQDYKAQVLAVRRPENLAASTDEPRLPFGWRYKLIVEPAAAMLLRQDGGESSLADATAHESEFKAALQAASETQVQAGPATHPTPSSLLLPKGLRGESGTFLELAQRVCYEANMNPWDRYALERAKEAVNQVQRSIVDMDEDWDFLQREGRFTVQAGKDLYRIQQIAEELGVSRIRQIKGIVYDSLSNRMWLRSMSWDELERTAFSTRDGDYNGIPRAYAVWTDRIRFYPQPATKQTYGIYYIVDAGDLVEDNEVCQLPPEWVHEVLVPLAASRVLYQTDDQAEFQRGQVLESVAKKAQEKFLEARGSAKQPVIHQYEPLWSADLPGGAGEGWYGGG